MQNLIEEGIRWIGCVALPLVTFSRYRGGAARDRLSEGAIGFLVVALLAYTAYRFGIQFVG